MCRIEDEYEWIVDAELLVKVGRDTHCEDCGRIVPAVSPMVRLDCVMTSGDEVLIVEHPDERHHRLTLDVDADAGVWEALGFETWVDEKCEAERHWWCQQCHAANRWLVAVCHQSTVLVTVEDLCDHLHDHDAEWLGRDFVFLAELAGRRWRTPDWAVADVRTVRAITKRAIEHHRAILKEAA